jgi:adenylate cyclase
MAGRPLLDPPLVNWLLTDARRIAEPKAFVAALAERFLAHGIDVSRLVTGVPILHPQVHSYSARWDLGQGASERFFRLTAETLPVLENSPVKTVYTGGGSVRCDPTAPPREGEFNILADLRREGATDYVALSVPFSDGTAKLLRNSREGRSPSHSAAARLYRTDRRVCGCFRVNRRGPLTSLRVGRTSGP